MIPNNKWMELFLKYKEVLLYGIVGVVTTIINFGTYYVFDTLLHLNYIVSDIIAWIISVIFAFFANKIWVFESKSWEASCLVKEGSQFLLSRIATGVLDVILMFIFVDVCYMNGNLGKILDLVITTIINFGLSKLTFSIHRK